MGNKISRQFVEGCFNGLWHTENATTLEVSADGKQGSFERRFILEGQVKHGRGKAFQ